MRKVAFVSGNVKGIGKAMTIKLIEMGYIVPIHYRKSEDSAIELKKEIEKRYRLEVPVYRADITNPKEIETLKELILKDFNDIDILINNVGDYLYKNLLDLSFEEWKYILDSNLNSAFLLTQSFLNYIKRRIIFLGFAGVNIRAYPFTTAYNIAKAGILIYAKSLAKLLAKKGITVNVISVGVAENSVTKPINEIPMGRLARMEEICSVLEFFINQDSDYITGQVVEVSGGWNL